MKSSIRLKVGRKIRYYRSKRRYTQEKLAELANVDYKYLQRIEGKNPPALKIDTIGKLAKAIGVFPRDLL